MVFFVMMVIKGMSYALNNPTKEILYQVGAVYSHMPNIHTCCAVQCCAALYDAVLWYFDDFLSHFPAPDDIHEHQVQVQVVDRHVWTEE
jgi:hypothetical protein